MISLRLRRLAGVLCEFLPLLLLVVLAARAAAVTLEVPGQFSTIQAAIDAASDGDIIYVGPDVYEENLVIQAKNVTLHSDFVLTGNSADIDGTIIDGGGGDFGIRIHPDSGATIVGFTIRNAVDGIFPNGALFFLDGRITDTNDGIDFEDGSSGAVRDSVFDLNSDDGIDVDNKVDVVIERNMIVDNRDDGIEVRLHADSFGEGETLDIVIRENLIVANGEDGIQLINYPVDVPGGVLTPRIFHIERNIIADNAMAGIGMMDEENTTENFEAAPIPETVFLFNNTIVGNSHGLSGGANVTAVNNLIVDNEVLGIKNVSGDSIAAFTLFWGNAVDHVGSNVDGDTTPVADPLLTPESELMEGSPAIDAGTGFFEVGGEVVLDLAESEFDGLAPDLGAIEFVPEPGRLLAHLAAMATVAVLARRRCRPGGGW